MTCGTSEWSPTVAAQASLVVTPTPSIQTLVARGGRGSTNKKRSRKKTPHEIHRAFTRAQQDSRLYNLKLDVNDLKQELRDLAVRRELLQARAFLPRTNSDAVVLTTVGRYFHGFGPGYRGDHEHADQSAFVRSIVDEDFSLGVTGLGVDMLLEQWLRYTELFHVRETYLHSAEVITSATDDDDEPSFVVAKCVMDFRGVLTRTAVDMIFPTACRDPELLLQALGREIAIPMLFHLFFNEDGRLVRHDAVADFFSAVREALGGDIDTAVRFIADAHVGQESMLGPIPEPVSDSEIMLEKMRQKKLRSADDLNYPSVIPVRDLFEAESFPPDDHSDDGQQAEWTDPAPAVISPSMSEEDLVDLDFDEQQKRANGAWGGRGDATKSCCDSRHVDCRHSVNFLLSPP